MSDGVVRVVFHEDAIHERVVAIAEQISKDFAGQEIVLVGLLNGCILFLADLAREIERIRLRGEGVASCIIDFMRLSSYGKGKTSSGQAEIQADMQRSPEGRVIIVVDEVAETLNTTHLVVEHIRARDPKEVRVCVMVDKTDLHKRDDVELHYVGFSQRNLPFLEGYGMDDKQAKRGLPHIARCD